MTVRDLNKNQLDELKQAYATQLADCGKLKNYSESVMKN